MRGEIVLLVDAQPSSDEGASSVVTVHERIIELQKTEGIDEMDALKRIARERGLAKSEVYRELQRERKTGR